jgi:Copper amine oxidase N-terminal domain
MKKVILCSLVLTLLLSLCSTATAAVQTSIELFLNGKFITSDASPRVIKNSVYVPLRSLSSMDLKYTWDQETQAVTVKNNDITVVLTVGKNTAFKNGVEFKLTSPPILIQGRTFVPLRFIAEAFDAKVRWYGNSQSVTILTPKFIEEQSKMLFDLMDPNQDRKQLDQKVRDLVGSWGALLDLSNDIPVSLITLDLYHIWFQNDDPTKLAIRVINRPKSGDVAAYSREWLEMGKGPVYDLIVQLEVTSNTISVSWVGQLTNDKNKISNSFDPNDALDSRLKELFGEDWGFQKVTGNKLAFNEPMRGYHNSYLGDLIPMDIN